MPNRNNISEFRRQRTQVRANHRKTSKVTPPIPILTAEEMTQGCELQRRYDVIEEQFHNLTHDALGDAWKDAADTYQQSPNAENFAAMKSALLVRSFYRADIRARAVCRMALQQFSSDNVAPWALAIVERNLALAAHALRKVTAVESARVKKLTGAPLTHSDIVEKAVRPVKHLESIKIRLTANAGGGLASPHTLLDVFAAVGSADFEALVDPLFPSEEIADSLTDAEQEAAGHETELDEAGVFE